MYGFFGDYDTLMESMKYMDFEDAYIKQMISEQYIQYMLNRTQGIFEYKNLPSTIPQRNLELLLQTRGYVAIAQYSGDKAENGLYALFGGLGGEPNAYYEPTVFTGANPYLGQSFELKIDEECIIIRNDSTYFGLLPMFARYASLLTENSITMRIADINARIKILVSAQDERTRASANEFFKNISDGKIGCVAEQAFMDSLKSLPVSSQTGENITDLIEYEQYLRASWFNDIGLNANFNMKRERLNSSENEMNIDALIPLVDDMLRNRKEGIEKVNNMFGTNIEVELSGVWGKTNDNIYIEGNNLSDAISNTDNRNNDNILADSEHSESDRGEPEPKKEDAEEPKKEDIEEIKEDIEEIKEDIEKIKESGGDE